MLFSKDMTASSTLRQRICDSYIADETTAINALLAEVQLTENERDTIAHRAHGLITAIRKQQRKKTSIDTLLDEYQLTSAEGRAFMCLAETLLRIPDQHTAIALIADKLMIADWHSHISKSRFVSINLRTRIFVLATAILSFSHEQQWFKRTLFRCITPLIVKATYFFIRKMAEQFVLGQSIDDALQKSKSWQKRAYCFSYDMLGESARSKKDELRYFEQYATAIKTIGLQAKSHDIRENPGISVKLSALCCRYTFPQQERVFAELIPRLKKLAMLAKKHNISLIIDAEESSRLELSLDVFETLYLDSDLARWQGFGLAVQAYQKRAPAIIDWLIKLSEKRNRQIMVRLVKGAYWDSEIKWAQEKGLTDYPVYTTRAATDVSYLICAQKLLAARQYVYPQFATHNAYTVASILQIDNSGAGYEFQRLHSMGQALYDQILKQTVVKCRVYAPVGKYVDLLSYLVRRLLENGANSSFVNNVVDDTYTIDSLITDPIDILQQDHNNPATPLPRDIYQNEFTPKRISASGFDLSDRNALVVLKQKISPLLTTQLNFIPPQASVLIHNPANHQEIVGGVQFDNKTTLESKITQAVEIFPTWSGLKPAARSHFLDQIALKLEEHQAELIAFCIKEAGKTLEDSQSELREAIDFCRYYSKQAEQLLDNHNVSARGVVLCISPWNFPLAIFIGQVAAALACGNTVLAKAAEQTGLVARRIIELIYETDIPKEVVQLLLGPGKSIGEILVPDARIQAVMFTGSCETAVWINQALANRTDNAIPFIAETGGQNAMIVDSSAHLEEVVDDVIKSGFNSAGQRCSSLRVLFIQAEIADELIEHIQGALAELEVGDPQWLKTDIGPIIDKKAIEGLEEHCGFLHRYRIGKAKLLYKKRLDKNLPGGFYYAPQLYEIDSLDVLKEEVFGPIVHVVRYKRDELDAVVEQINKCRYGLTLGIHSRINTVHERLCKQINVGNVYINRSMVGAVVGSQPFGGRGLSGTGPKSGGPHYLEVLVKSASENSCSNQNFNEENVEVEAKLKQMQIAWNRWEQLGVEKRIEHLKLLGGEVAKIKPIFNTFGAIYEKKIEMMQTDLSKQIVLPGPTGEANLLSYESRGLILAVGDNEKPLPDWLDFLFMALGVGNAVICAVSDEELAVINDIKKSMPETRFPENVFQFVPHNQVMSLLEHELISAVVSPIENAYVRQVLAQRQGPIRPYVCSNEPFSHNRLVWEKTVSIDTTAAVGNAFLLSQ